MCDQDCSHWKSVETSMTFPACKAQLTFVSLLFCYSLSLGCFPNACVTKAWFPVHESIGGLVEGSKVTGGLPLMGYWVPLLLSLLP